jgi:hypothetical protein
MSNPIATRINSELRWFSSAPRKTASRRSPFYLYCTRYPEPAINRPRDPRAYARFPFSRSTPPSRVNLQLTMERWPDVTFNTTREQQ